MPSFRLCEGPNLSPCSIVNLRSNALLHCLKVATGDLIVFGNTLIDAVKEVKDDLTSKMLCFGDHVPENVDWCERISIDSMRKQYSSNGVPNEVREAAIPPDLMLFIYTSALCV